MSCCLCVSLHLLLTAAVSHCLCVPLHLCLSVSLCLTASMSHCLHASEGRFHENLRAVTTREFEANNSAQSNRQLALQVQSDAVGCMRQEVQRIRKVSTDSLQETQSYFVRMQSQLKRAVSALAQQVSCSLIIHCLCSPVFTGSRYSCCYHWLSLLLSLALLIAFTASACLAV